MNARNVLSFPKPHTFKIGDHEGLHRTGDTQCNAGSCGTSWLGWYPKRCICGGLIHCEDGHLHFSDSYYGAPPSEYCDNCGWDQKAVSDVIGGVLHVVKDACMHELGMSLDTSQKTVLVEHADFCRTYLARELHLQNDATWEEIGKALELEGPYPQYPSKYKKEGQGERASLELCRRLKTRQCGLPPDATWEEIQRVSYEPRFIKIRVGNCVSKQWLANSLKQKGVDLKGAREHYLLPDIFASDDFYAERTEREIELVLVRSGLLGTDNKCSVLARKGLEYGLDLCPAETALQLCLQDKLSPSQWLIVMSKPFTICEDRRKKVLGAGRDDCGSMLLYPTDYDSITSDNHSEALVFMRSPTKELCLPKWEG